MLTETINFVDYNGVPRQAKAYFHLNEVEIVKMQAASENGIQQDMEDAILSNDVKRVWDFIEGLVHASYGKKSTDGLSFDKSPEILREFVNSAYYSDFMLGLIQDNGEKGQAFVKGIMPAKLVERAVAQVQGQDGGEPIRQSVAPSARETFDMLQKAKETGIMPQMQTVADPPSPVDRTLNTVFGQPDYPRVDQTQQAPAQPQNDPEYARFLAWQAQQNQQKEVGNPAASAPASPDAFRVPAEEPMQGMSRPPHEQVG